MNGSNQKGPLIWGVILILLGFLFLLQNWLGVRFVWRLVHDWWPLILIAFGTLKIYRYFTYRGV
jgi:hypothetical protein